MKTPKWFVAYTRARFEKKVHLEIQRKGIQSYLPLHKVKRQWSDRIKLVEVPLFSSYIFVKTTLDKIPKLMELKGIARFLSFDGKFATIREEEINMIEKVLNNDCKDININIRPKKSIIIGQKIKIEQGVFTGLEGIFLKEHGKDCLVISIPGLNQDLLITMPNTFIERESISMS